MTCGGSPRDSRAVDPGRDLILLLKLGIHSLSLV